MVVVSILFIHACKKEETNNIACIPSGLQNGVIAFYPFSNGSLNDFSGNNNNLTNGTGAHAAPDRNGNSSCAFQFTNLPLPSTQFLTRSNPTFLNSLSAFSVSLWYQPKDSSKADGDFETLLSRGQGLSCPNKHGQWSIGLYDCRRAVFGRLSSVWDLPVPGVSTCAEEVKVLTGRWHHLVATFNGSANGEMKIYKDGVLQATETGTAPCSVTPTVQDIGDLFIGNDYTGCIDDIIIYNKALSQAEVTQLRAIEPCCAE